MDSIRSINLPSRPGLKSSCEESFTLLAYEIESAFLRRAREYEEKCQHQEHMLKQSKSKIKDLEDHLDSCMVIQKENNVLKQQLIYMDNSYKTQISELKDELKALKDNYDDIVKRNQRDLDSSEKDKIQEQKQELERHLFETKRQLSLLKNNEVKLVDNIRDLNTKLKNAEKELENKKKQDQKKKFPLDSEVDDLARKIADRFFNEQTKNHDENRKEIITKIQDIEDKLNL